MYIFTYTFYVCPSCDPLEHLGVRPSLAEQMEDFFQVRWELTQEDYHWLIVVNIEFTIGDGG